MPTFLQLLGGQTGTVTTVPVGTAYPSYCSTSAANTCWQTAALTNQSTSGIWSGLTNQTQTTSNWYSENQGVLVDHQTYMALAQARVTICRQRTEEERAAEEMRMQQAQAAAAMRMQQAQAALTRSRELLLAHLSSAQRDSFEALGWFVVQGGKSKERYRIRTNGYAGNVERLKGDKAVYRYCAHCEGVPLHDHHLAQKLLLQYDEDRFLATANRSAA